MLQNHNIREKFIGTWKLVSITIMHAGRSLHPFGKQVKGLLIYTSKFMSVQIMMPVHYPISHERKLSIKLEEFAHSLKTAGYMGYWGTWKVNIENRTVVHRVEGSIAQLKNHANEIRKYEFSNGNLILSSGALELQWVPLE